MHTIVKKNINFYFLGNLYSDTIENGTILLEKGYEAFPLNLSV